MGPYYTLVKLLVANVEHKKTQKSFFHLFVCALSDFSPFTDLFSLSSSILLMSFPQSSGQIFLVIISKVFFSSLIKVKFGTSVSVSVL